MPKTLLLLGGGHAHLAILSRLGELLNRGHRVALVQPSEHHYYSGMGPGMLGRIYSPEEIRFHTKAIVERQGGRFVLDRAVAIEPEAKQVRLASGTQLAYDVLSCNVGSSVPGDPVRPGRDVFAVKPIATLLEGRQRVLEAAARSGPEVGVVGGGPAGLEIAGNLHRLLREASASGWRIRIFAGGRFLKRQPAGVRRKARRKLARMGIEVLEQGYVREAAPGAVTLAGGDRYPADLLFLASGVRPPSLFVDSRLAAGPDGGLLVNSFLQHVDHPEIFGGGDCIHFKERPLDRVGVFAVRQNPVLADNLLAALEGRPLRPFDPGGSYMLIYNLGDGTGILHKSGFTLNGRVAFRIKDRIDRRFVRRFQALEGG